MALYNISNKTVKDNYFTIKIRKFKNVEELEKCGRYKFLSNQVYSKERINFIRTTLKGEDAPKEEFLNLSAGIHYRTNSTIALSVSCSVSDDTKINIPQWIKTCRQFLEDYFGEDNVRNMWLFEPQKLGNGKESVFITAFIIPKFKDKNNEDKITISHFINRENNISLFYDKFAEQVSYLGLKRGIKNRTARNLCLPEETMKWTIDRVKNELPATVSKPDDWDDMTLFEQYQWCNVQQNLQKWCMDAIKVFMGYKTIDLASFSFPDTRRNDFFSSSRLSELKFAKDYCGVWLLVILSPSLVDRNELDFNRKLTFILNQVGFLKENVYDYLEGINLSFLRTN